MEGVGMAMVFVWLLGLLVAILWVFIPFAVFGIKPLLREILAELKTANARTAPATARPKTLAELTDPK